MAKKNILSGKLCNCYGIRELELSDINFYNSNKAIIYAPNGVAKTSLAKTFEDISKGNITKDRIFKNEISMYDILYDDKKYHNKSIAKNKYFYTIHSFNNKVEISKEAIGTLLADEETRLKYIEITTNFKSEINEFKQKFSTLSGIKENDLENFFENILSLEKSFEWQDIFK